MNWKAILGAIAFAVAPTAVDATSPLWRVGQEREVDQGYYFKLLKAEAGWRLWRIETKSGVECRAVKSAIGRPHPYPLGMSVNFFGGEPFIVLYKSHISGTVTHFWKGADISNKSVQIRSVGQRFWTEEVRATDYEEGQKLEVNIASWEYPELRVGYHELKGMFDLSGIDAMRAAINQCV